MQLAQYVNDTQAILRDSLGLFTPTAQLTRWINESRRQVALRTGCLRFLVAGQAPYGTGSQPGNMIPGAVVPGTIPGAAANNFPSISPSTPTNGFNTIPGVEYYAYDYANPFLRQQYAGIDRIFDVLDVAVSWGGIRPALSWLPWNELQAYARSYNIGVTSYPFYWSAIDGENGQIWLFPVPSISGAGGQGEMEWSVLAVPLPLNTSDDFDAIPGAFQNAVKYYAASLACQPARMGLARIWEARFNEQLGISVASRDTGKIPNYYDVGP